MLTPRFRTHFPTNTLYSANDGLMLGHRLRRCPNINPPLSVYIVFAGLAVLMALSLIDISCATLIKMIFGGKNGHLSFHRGKSINSFLLLT